MSGPPKGKCTDCGAVVYWVRMRSGKKMPLDLVSIKRVLITPIPGTESDRKPSGEWAGDVLDTYQSHFASCPAKKKDAPAPAESPPEPIASA